MTEELSEENENKICFIMEGDKEIEYNLELFYRNDSLIIKADSDEKLPFEHYEGIFPLKSLKTIKFFETLSIDEILNKLSTLIDEKEIKISKSDKFIKLNYKDMFSLQIDEIRINLNERINDIINQMNVLNKKVKSLEEENKNLKKEITFLKKKLTENQINTKIKIITKNSDFNINLEKRLTTEMQNINNKLFSIYIKPFSLSILKTYQDNKEIINYVASFKNGNFITASSDYSLKLYDFHQSIIKSLEPAHSSSIISLDVKDNNLIISCSEDCIIKIWNYDNSNLIEIQKIENAHKSCINCIRFFNHSEKENQFMTCSNDKTIKIWEKSSKDENYYCIKTIINTDSQYLNCLIELDNFILSGGYDGVKIWDLNNYDLICSYRKCSCYSQNAMKVIDKDKFIVSSGIEKKMFVGSISEESLILEIETFCEVYCILNFNQGFFFVGGKDEYFRLYRSDTYDLFKVLKTDHLHYINGFFYLNEHLIGSYTTEGEIKLWKC